MSILFITGSLHQGRDGVGDYTHRLMAALRAQGVSCRGLSWHERSLRMPLMTQDTLRLPAGMTWRTKLIQVKHWLETGEAPTQISLQFVPYAFSGDGLPWDLATQIAPIIGEKPLHIFAHELWVMPCMRAPLKARLIGQFLQKRCVLNVFKQLAPKLISAAVPLYQEALTEAGFTTAALPLYGNIPVIPLKNKPTRPADTRILGFFGTIHPTISLEPFFESLSNLKATTGLHFVIRSAGSLDKRSQAHWEQARQKWGVAFTFERFGSIVPTEASYYFQSLDWALSTYSPVFWHKSGAIAAAREHGLPVVLLQPSELANHAALPEGVVTQLTADGLQTPPKPALPEGVDEVAKTFISQLHG